MDIDNTINLISVIRKEVHHFLVDELKKIELEELSPSHGSILAALFKYDEATMKEIARLIGRDKSTVTVLVNKLIKLGYVGRKNNLKDGRYSLIYLTKKGKMIQNEFEKISLKLFQVAYKDITENDKKILNRILRMIFNNFQDYHSS